MTAHPATTIWTSERVELLKELWARGDSCSAIAAEIGGGISKNSVIGKVTRLGLPLRGRSLGAASGQRRHQPIIEDDAMEIETDTATLQDMEARRPPPEFRSIKLLDLKENHCRYPRTIDNEILFCGEPKIEDSSYCARCYRRCHARAVNLSAAEIARRRGWALRMAEQRQGQRSA